MSDGDRDVRSLLGALQAIGVSDQVRGSIERAHGVLAGTEGQAVAELPAGSSVQVLECSSDRGHLHLAGHLAFPDIIDRVFIGTGPTTQLSELAIVHLTNSEVRFEGEVELAGGEPTVAALFVRTLAGAVFRIGDLAARGLAESSDSLPA
jgi:hypothetical protein